MLAPKLVSHSTPSTLGNSSVARVLAAEDTDVDHDERFAQGAGAHDPFCELGVGIEEEIHAGGQPSKGCLQ